MHSGLNESTAGLSTSDAFPELETRPAGVDDIGKGTAEMESDEGETGMDLEDDDDA